MPDSSVQPKFRRHQKLIHVASNTEYIVGLLPSEITLEHSGEPAYGYSNDGKAPYWVRGQNETEDGRFAPAPCALVPESILV